jgi:hypothetical protein
MSARSATAAAPAGIVRRSLAALLALLGGGLLLAEALLAALLLGTDGGATSPLRATLLLTSGGIVALCAARLLPEAPRRAAVLCLAAIGLAGLEYLPAVIALLAARYAGPSRFLPGQPSLDSLLIALLSWFVAAAPLWCAVALAWRRPPARPRERAVG